MRGRGARIWAIALNTFREAIRNKLLYAVLLAVVAANAFAMVLGEMSLHEEARVARDVGLGAMSFLGSLAAVVMGVLLLYNEVKRRTIHTVLSKPIHRYEFVLGKYVGMAATLSLLVGCFALATVGMLKLRGVDAGEAIVKAILLAWLEVLTVAAIAIFFSSFSSPILSGLFTIGLWVLGRVTPELRYAASEAKEPWIRETADLALRALPDLHVFAVSGSDLGGKHVTVHAEFVSWSYLGHAALYAAVLIAILLALASLIFWRRDFA